MAVGINQRLLNKASVGGTVGVTPPAFRSAGIRQTTHDIHWDAGVSVGEVTIEAADREDATDWASLQVVTFSGTAPKRETPIVLSGMYGAFRHRLSVPTNDGGTVTTKIRGELAED